MRGSYSGHVDTERREDFQADFCQQQFNDLDEPVNKIRLIYDTTRSPPGDPVVTPALSFTRNPAPVQEGGAFCLLERSRMLAAVGKRPQLAAVSSTKGKERHRTGSASSGANPPRPAYRHPASTSLNRLNHFATPRSVCAYFALACRVCGTVVTANTRRDTQTSPRGGCPSQDTSPKKFNKQEL